MKIQIKKNKFLNLELKKNFKDIIIINRKNFKFSIKNNMMTL